MAEDLDPKDVYAFTPMGKSYPLLGADSVDFAYMITPNSNTAPVRD